jgi:hypothetical protein
MSYWIFSARLSGAGLLRNIIPTAFRVKIIGHPSSNHLQYSSMAGINHLWSYVKVSSKAFCISTVQLHAVELYQVWRLYCGVKQAANKLCWLASMCKYNTQGSYSYNHCSGQRGSIIDH